MADLATTTLTHAVGPADTQVRLASVADVAVGQLLWFDGEAASVVALTGLSATVLRGAGGTNGVAHAALVTVYIGAPSQFYNVDPEGEPPDFPLNLPWINLRRGNVWVVVNNQWVLANDRDDESMVTKTALFTFDPSANAGERTVAAHVVGPVLPDTAVVTCIAWTVVTPFASADDTAEIAVGLNDADDVTDATVDSAAFQLSFSEDDEQWRPSLRYLVLTDNRQLTFTVSEQALTAGKLNGWLTYVVPAS